MFKPLNTGRFQLFLYSFSKTKVCLSILTKSFFNESDYHEYTTTTSYQSRLHLTKQSSYSLTPSPAGGINPLVLLIVSNGVVNLIYSFIYT